MSKTVMIFGAGASVPFFYPRLDTEALTCEVKNEDRWKSFISRYTEVMDDGVPEVEWEPIQDLIQRALCVDQRDPVHGLIQQALHLNQNLTFEELIEFIDKYSSYTIECGTGSAIQPKRLHNLLRFLSVNKDFSEMDWGRIPFLFRQMIAEVIEEWNSKYRVPDYCNLLDKQSEFLSEQLQQGNLSLYTFNYDDVLPQTVLTRGIPLETGFNCGRFDSAKFLKAPSILAFPHGHARWVQDDDGIREFASISDANCWRLRHLNDSGGEKTKCYNDEPWICDFNTFLTTGQDKESSFNRNPYCAYYQRLAKDLTEADSAVVVGYSFRDPHINRLLLNFRSLQDKNKVLVVDYLKRDINLVGEFVSFASSLKPLLNAYNVGSILVLSRYTSHPYKYKEQLDKTNKNGYGFLYPQIWIDKRGYDKFLSEWRDVIAEWRESA